jgi:phage gp45-like
MINRQYSQVGQPARQTNAIRIGHLVTPLNTEKKNMRAQVRVLDADVPEFVTVLHPAGFYSRPKSGDKAAVIVFGSGDAGSTRYALMLGDVDQYPKMEKDGDLYIASPDNKEFGILLRKDGTIVLKGKSVTHEMETFTVKAKKIDFQSDNIKLNGDTPLGLCGGGCATSVTGS